MTKIVFDASVLESDFYKDNRRSGIFQCTKELFDTLYENKLGEYSIYSDIHSYHEVVCYFKKNYPHFTVYTNANAMAKAIQIIECKLKNAQSRVKLSLIRKAFSLGIKVCGVFIRWNLAISSQFDAVLKESDVFFSSMLAIPGFLKGYDLKCVLLVHDLIPLKLKNYSGQLVGWFGDVCRSFNKRDYYFTNSDYTRKDLLELFGYSVDEKKVFNTYIGVSDTFRPINDRNLFHKVKTKYGFTSDKFLFSLCNIEERKNLIMQAKAFIRLISEYSINDLVFLMGGGAQHFHILKKELEEEIPAKMLDKIVFIGYVDDEDLPVLYSNAMWFTYTSKYEGFGLPPLEAMKCGCPVVTSNRSSLPEVCGDAAIIVDSDSEDEHVAAYKTMYFDEDLRNDYSEKGIMQGRKFSWNKIASHMYELMCSMGKETE